MTDREGYDEKIEELVDELIYYAFDTYRHHKDKWMYLQALAIHNMRLEREEKGLQDYIRPYLGRGAVWCVVPCGAWYGVWCGMKTRGTHKIPPL